MGAPGPLQGERSTFEQYEPLGVACSVGRWVSKEMVSPEQRIPLSDSYAFAPAYAPPLDHAADEAAYVCNNFSGELISAGVHEELETAFGKHSVALVHFVCHGEIGDTGQVSRLENGGLLHSY
jgi:hypothetical protein